jgi:hypothetical protein
MRKPLVIALVSSLGLGAFAIHSSTATGGC